LYSDSLTVLPSASRRLNAGALSPGASRVVLVNSDPFATTSSTRPARRCLAGIPFQVRPPTYFRKVFIIRQRAAGAAPCDLGPFVADHALDGRAVFGVDVRLAHGLLEQRVVCPDRAARGSASLTQVHADHLIGVALQYLA